MMELESTCDIARDTEPSSLWARYLCVQDGELPTLYYSQTIMP